MNRKRAVATAALTLAAAAVPTVAGAAAADTPAPGTQLAFGTFGGSLDRPNDTAASLTVRPGRKLDVSARAVKSDCPDGQTGSTGSASGVIGADGTFSVRIPFGRVAGRPEDFAVLSGRFVRGSAVDAQMRGAFHQQHAVCSFSSPRSRGYAQGKGLEGTLRPDAVYVGLLSQHSGVLPSTRQPFLFRVNAASNAITPFVIPAVNVTCPSGSTEANPFFLYQRRIDIRPDGTFQRTGGTVIQRPGGRRAVDLQQTSGRFGARGVTGRYRIDAYRQDASGRTIERCTTGQLTFTAVRVGAALPGSPGAGGHSVGVGNRQRAEINQRATVGG